MELTAENADQVVVRAKSGTLLISPAYSQHPVAANTSEEERISISFNIMLSLLHEESQQTAVVNPECRLT